MTWNGGKTTQETKGTNGGGRRNEGTIVSKGGVAQSVLSVYIKMAPVT